MSESQLNREFSKRDVQRMRNIVTGNTANRTRVQAGYERNLKNILKVIFGRKMVNNGL